MENYLKAIGYYDEKDEELYKKLEEKIPTINWDDFWKRTFYQWHIGKGFQIEYYKQAHYTVYLENFIIHLKKQIRCEKEILDYEPFNYLTKKWKRIRAEYLKSINFQCELKFEECTEYATEVHHINSAGYKDIAYEFWNLQGSCLSCHNKLKRNT